MSLDLQIKTIIFSFLFGIYLSIILDINYKFLYHDKKSIRFLSTFILIIGNVLLYFLILQKINQGVLHLYGILLIIIGYLLEHFLHHKILSIIAKDKKK